MNEFTRTRIDRQIRIMSAHAIAHRARGEDVAAARAQAWADAAKAERASYGADFRRRVRDNGFRFGGTRRPARGNFGDFVHGRVIG